MTLVELRALRMYHLIPNTSYQFRFKGTKNTLKTAVEVLLVG